MDDNIALNIREGKTVRVTQKIIDAKRERSVPFIGVVKKVRGSGVNKTITVRQVLEGVEVDRIFSVAAPTILKIELIEVREKAKKSKKSATKRKKKSKSKK